MSETLPETALGVRRLSDLGAVLKDKGYESLANACTESATVMITLERENARLRAELEQAEGYPGIAHDFEQMRQRAEQAEAALAELERKRDEFRKANPLGGVAKMFEAMACRIRAGESYADVLDDYEFVEKRQLAAATREALERAATICETDLARNDGISCAEAIRALQEPRNP